MNYELLITRASGYRLAIDSLGCVCRLNKKTCIVKESRLDHCNDD